MEFSPQSPVTDLIDVLRESGIVVLPDLFRLVTTVRHFGDSISEHDLHSAHDFGALVWYVERVLWTSDDCNHEILRAEDPLAPESRRVLTTITGGDYERLVRRGGSKSWA